MISSLSTSLTPITWQAIWKYLRTASTLPLVRMRLDEILCKFPKSKTYIDFLWRNVATWATCAFTWELDYGFQASSMQEGTMSLLFTLSVAVYDTTPICEEGMLNKCVSLQSLFKMSFSFCISGIHSSLKHNLHGVLLPLHKAISFFRESLMRRKLNVDRKNCAGTLKSLLASTITKGFSIFAKQLTASLTDEGIKLTLVQFHEGVGYRVEKIVSSSAIHAELVISEKKRGPSAARFRCLVTAPVDSIASDPEFISGDYYKVTSRSIDGSTDIVFVGPGGNIACTSSSYSRYGIPSKHIFAVFYDGAICLNMKLHFHPVYHLQFINDIADELSAGFTVTADIKKDSVILTDSTTCWNWAQQESFDSWERIGLGGAAYDSVAHPTAKSISTAPESITEKIKKAINFIVPFVKNSVEEREIFYLYYEGLLKRYD